MMMARFIGMLDILGITRLVEERGIMEIHKVISELFKSVQKGTSIDFSAIIDGRYYRHPAVRLDYFIFSLSESSISHFTKCSRLYDEFECDEKNQRRTLYI